MKKFSYEANGYNRSEVIDFVDYVIGETKELIAVIKKQEQEIKDLKAEKDKKTAEEKNFIREMAELEAENIVYDAKEYASMILNDTLQRADVLEKKNNILENNIKENKNKLSLMINEFETVLNKIENIKQDDE